jgi:uncharacterized membrane protein YedE/YeeE
VSGGFEPLRALLGGALLGVGLVMVLLASGRVAGVSGVLGALVPPRSGDWAWRLAFLMGLLAGGVAVRAVVPEVMVFSLDRSAPALVVAGLLVGYGSRLGNGCTSGHGVCGLARLSPRSLLATAVFIATGAVTVFVVNHFEGGRL